MKHFKFALFFFILFFGANAFASSLKEKTSESFAYYYYQQRNYNQAIEEYKNILRKDPRNVKAHYNLATLYCLTKKYPLAIKEFKKILKIHSPLEKDTLYNLTVVYGRYLKDNKNASKYYVRFKKIQK